jgi:hypothetical protein
MNVGNGEGRDGERCVKCHLKKIEAKHGTVSKYTGGCRCEDCTRANTDYHRELRARRRAELSNH